MVEMLGVMLFCSGFFYCAFAYMVLVAIKGFLANFHKALNEPSSVASIELDYKELDKKVDIGLDTLFICVSLMIVGSCCIVVSLFLETQLLFLAGCLLWCLYVVVILYRKIALVLSWRKEIQQCENKRPVTIKEAFDDLDRCFLDKDAQILFASVTEAAGMICFHSNLGRHIRNEWGLWEESSLAQLLNNYGLTHADDMSGAILSAYWQHKNNEPHIFLDALK